MHLRALRKPSFVSAFVGQALIQRAQGPHEMNPARADFLICLVGLFCESSKSVIISARKTKEP